MENYYNMMAIMNNIITMSIILSMLGFGGLFMGVFYLLDNELLTSVGYRLYDNEYFIIYISIFDK